MEVSCDASCKASPSAAGGLYPIRPFGPPPPAELGKGLRRRSCKVFPVDGGGHTPSPDEERLMTAARYHDFEPGGGDVSAGPRLLGLEISGLQRKQRNPEHARRGEHPPIVACELDLPGRVRT